MKPDISAYLHLFDKGDFHAAHDTLEPRWIETRSHTLQGLIQLAVGWHHWRRGNVHGARVLWTKSLGHLEQAADEPPEGLDLDAIRQHLRHNVEVLSDGRPQDSSSIALVPPVLRRL